MNRSDFFRRLGLAVAALFVPQPKRRRIICAGPPLNWTHGDGIHDDTEAIQALLDRTELLPVGTFRITKTLNVRKRG